MTSAHLALRRSEADKLTTPLLRIVTSGARMSRMIDQLLDFTRVRVGAGIPLVPRRLDLVPLLRQVMDELDDAYPDWVLTLEQQGDTWGTWDPDRLSQVFSNVVANSLQHGIPEEGLRVSIEGNAPDAVVVEVHNKGTVPDVLLPKLFEPMTGGQHRRDKSRGLGLGLYISQEILKAHGGRIDVRSSGKEGTTFTVLLPRNARGMP
jgi:signal transduction histidine kinase